MGGLVACCMLHLWVYDTNFLFLFTMDFLMVGCLFLTTSHVHLFGPTGMYGLWEVEDSAPRYLLGRTIINHMLAFYDGRGHLVFWILQVCI